MELYGVYEDGNIFKPDVLDVDIDEFIGKISTASSNAFALALEAGWYNKLTIQPLIMKAHFSAFALALESGVITKDTIKHLLGKANAQMLSLKNKTNQ